MQVSAGYGCGDQPFSSAIITSKHIGFRSRIKIEEEPKKGGGGGEITDHVKPFSEMLISSLWHSEARLL